MRQVERNCKFLRNAECVSSHHCISCRVLKECRLLEITRYFMLIPEVRKIFEREDPKSLEQIKLILDKHANSQRIAK